MLGTDDPKKIAKHAKAGIAKALGIEAQARQVTGSTHDRADARAWGAIGVVALGAIVALWLWKRGRR